MNLVVSDSSQYYYFLILSVSKVYNLSLNIDNSKDILSKSPQSDRISRGVIALEDIVEQGRSVDFFYNLGTCIVKYTISYFGM